MKKAFKKKIIITGGKGLLGSHFYKLSKKKFNIIKYPHRIENKIKFNNFIKFRKFDYFIHFAALTRNNKNQNRKIFNEINVKSSIEIIKTLKNNNNTGIKYFIFISSSHVYGHSNKKISEIKKRKPNNIYGKSKKKVEDFIIKNRKEIPFKIGIARVFNITGKKQKKGFFIPDIIKKIRFTNKINNINKYRDFIHLDDVVKSLNLMISKKYNSEINISSGRKINLIDVCKRINDLYFKKKIKYNMKKGEDIYGSNNRLKQLGLNKFKDIDQIIKSL